MFIYFLHVLWLYCTTYPENNLFYLNMHLCKHYLYVQVLLYLIFTQYFLLFYLMKYNLSVVITWELTLL